MYISHQIPILKQKFRGFMRGNSTDTLHIFNITGLDFLQHSCDGRETPN